MKFKIYKKQNIKMKGYNLLINKDLQVMKMMMNQFQQKNGWI